MIDPSEKKHASIERATTTLVKNIRGTGAGLVLLVLGLVWMGFAIRGYVRFKKAHPKPL